MRRGRRTFNNLLVSRATAVLEIKNEQLVLPFLSYLEK